jgi:hypothetical protein
MMRKSWPQTKATIHRCDWQKRPWYQPTPGHYRVVFLYEVDDHPLIGEYRAYLPEAVGAEFLLHYNPAKPEQNDRTHRHKRDWLVTAGGLLILAVGTFLYIHFHGWHW